MRRVVRVEYMVKGDAIDGVSCHLWIIDLSSCRTPHCTPLRTVDILPGSRRGKQDPWDIQLSLSPHNCLILIVLHWTDILTIDTLLVIYFNFLLIYFNFNLHNVYYSGYYCNDHTRRYPERRGLVYLEEFIYLLILSGRIRWPNLKKAFNIQEPNQ